MELFILLVLGLCCHHASSLQDDEVDVDCDDPNVFSIVDQAIKAFNEGKAASNVFALNVILKAKKKVGPSEQYTVNYSIRETICPAGSISWKKCQLKPISEASTGNCTAHIHISEGFTIMETCILYPVVRTVIPVHASCLGCWKPLNTKSLSLLPLVRHTIRQFNRDSDHPFHFEVGKITSAKSQVVAGWNYNYKYLVKETNCSKEAFPDLTPECKPIAGGRIGECEVMAYVNISNILVYARQKCKLQEVHPPDLCLGCEVKISTHDQEMMEMLEEALKKYNSENDDHLLYTIDEIISATSQIVAGVIYRVAFKIRATNCSKAEVQELNENCVAMTNAKQLDCKASLYAIPWLSKFYPQVTCIYQQTTTVYRRPPGFTPFRSARRATNHENADGLGHLHGHGHDHGHGHHGHEYGHQNPKDRPSKEFSEDLKNQEDPSLRSATEITVTPLTIGHPVTHPTRNPNEEIAGTPDPLLQKGSTWDSLFESQPDLPEPILSKCPGKPWKPEQTPTASPPDSDEFRIEDALP